jgi:hypothetical protein
MTAQAYRDDASFLVAIDFLRAHVGCEGPLCHLPTSDPGVQALCQAIRHLMARRQALQQRVAL